MPRDGNVHDHADDVPQMFEFNLAVQRALTPLNLHMPRGLRQRWIGNHSALLRALKEALIPATVASSKGDTPDSDIRCSEAFRRYQTLFQREVDKANLSGDVRAALGAMASVMQAELQDSDLRYGNALELLMRGVLAAITADVDRGQADYIRNKVGLGWRCLDRELPR